jgi:hypothetical protein
VADVVWSGDHGCFSVVDVDVAGVDYFVAFTVIIVVIAAMP